MGTSTFMDGKDEESGPWYDLSAQDIQPLYPEQPGMLSASCYLQDAWCGGSSLQLQGTIPPGEERVAVRLFSLQMPAPPKLFLTLLYKLEGPQPDDFTVALEVTTWDSGICLEGNPTSLPEPNGRYHPRFLPAPPPGLAKLLAACHRGSQGWTSRCYELELQDCSLRDLSLIVSRQQPSPQATSFTCLLGEIRVLDTASVAASPPQVHSVAASQLWWQEGPEPELLSLSLTLRWSFPPGRARWFRVLSQGARCRLGQTAPQVLGLAQGCLFRAVGLVVPRPAPGQSCRLELLVEPVLRDELPVDPERWGRLVLVYSAPGSGAGSDGH
ncbi:hypothetical protein Nmel_016427 [Mimus melanotis]